MPPKSSKIIDEEIVEELIPERIRKFLGPGPAIGLEDNQEFEALFDVHVIELGAQDTLEIFDLRDIATKRFQLRQLMQIRQAAIEKYLPHAAVDLMGAAYRQVADVKDMEKIDMFRDFQDLFRQASNGDPSAMAVLKDLAKKSGITSATLLHEAYIRALKTIVHLDDAIAKQEKSLTKLISSFQTRRDTLNTMNKILLRAPKVLDADHQSEDIPSESDDENADDKS